MVDVPREEYCVDEKESTILQDFGEKHDKAWNLLDASSSHPVFSLCLLLDIQTVCS